MRRIFMAAFFLLFVPIAHASGPTDPYLWLEDSASSKTQAWVKAQNQITEDILKKDPRFEAAKAATIAILTAQDKLPAIVVHNGMAYNFWQDKNHKRGIWRRTPADRVSDPQAEWQTILDVDALAAAEKEDWYSASGACRPPEYTQCMVGLSRGGKDAHVVREFDVTTGKFVVGGFSMPEAKSAYDWLDKDTLIVATDWGPDTLTKSGYPAQVRKWKRGEPLTNAKLLLQVEHDDISAEPLVDYDAHTGQTKVFATRRIDFFSSEYYWMDKDDKAQHLLVPPQVDLKDFFGDHLIFTTIKDWSLPGGTIPAGALVSIALKNLLSPVNASAVENIYRPNARQTFASVAAVRDFVYVSTLDNVRGQLMRYRRLADGKWIGQTIPVPENGAVSLTSWDGSGDDLYFLFSSFLTPTSILKVDGTHGDTSPKTLRRLPDRFDASRFVTEQAWAKSKDGTKIPYFVVRAKNMKFDGGNPTLLTGYGGFNYSETPFYSSIYGKLWLEKGGVLVVANIRGGGEFGPKWHDAAIREHRQRAYDDFISVAEDLIHRKITAPARLGIMGGSNGGLLVGTVAVERPDLFGAVLCQVPLLDMIRYTHIAAGASWIAEYGDPDVPADAAFILKYSPYQNVKPGVPYPLIYFQTASTDDRVSPVHARKMAAKMQDQGHQVLFHETLAGGHTGGSDYEIQAEDNAMDYAYLYERLMGGVTAAK